MAADASLAFGHGGRHSRVKFQSEDRYVRAGNPDDSGHVTHGQVLPVMSFAHLLAADRTVYLSAGADNGRTTFRNAGSTRRHGVEIQVDVRLAPLWHWQAAYTWLQAGPRDGVLDGRTLRGIPEQSLFAEFTYQVTPAWRVGMSVQGASKVHVNDANSEASPSLRSHRQLDGSAVCGFCHHERWQRALS